MPALSLVPRIDPQILPPQTVDVSVLDFELRSAAKSYRYATMRIAYFGVRLRYALMDDWSKVKVKDEEEYRKALGISQATWYRTLKLGQALFMVKLSDMEKIAVGNAELLIQVEPALWHDFPWVQDAQRLSADEFSQLVVQRHRQVGSRRVDPQSYFRVKVPYTIKHLLLGKLENFRLEHNLATPGEALECLLGNIHKNPNALMDLDKARRCLDRVEFRFKNSKVFREERGLILAARNLVRKAHKTIRSGDEENIHEEDAQEVCAAEGAAELQDCERRRRNMFVKSRRPDGEEAPNHAAVSRTVRDLCAVRSADGIIGDDDRLREQG